MVSKGTDDDFPPPHQNKMSRGSRISGNGRPANFGLVPYPRVYEETDIEARIHQLEQEAYISILRAFKAQADAITWVLVMTSQIILNILRHNIVKMEAINLLILDECHHAVKKHPYSLVMSEFYHTTPKEKMPSVFGMTASPVNLKGVSSQVDCAVKIRNLESKLDSVVYG